MDNQNPLIPFSQHYLEIQALDPTFTEPNPTPSPTTSSLIGWPILLIISFIFAIIGYAWYARKRSMQSLLVSLVGVIMITSISIGVSHISSPQSTFIQADSLLTPTNVIINKSDSAGFVISWQTSEETSGAVKISPNPTMQELVMVYTDPNISGQHQVTVSNLDPTKTYYAQVLSDSVWFDHGGSPITLSLQE